MLSRDARVERLPLAEEGGDVAEDVTRSEPLQRDPPALHLARQLERPRLHDVHPCGCVTPPEDVGTARHLLLTHLGRQLLYVGRAERGIGTAAETAGQPLAVAGQSSSGGRHTVRTGRLPALFRSGDKRTPSGPDPQGVGLVLRPW